MKPILFPKNATTFTTNGIGRLSDAVSCIVTEELNGQYELEMRYPVDGKYFSEIGMNSIIMSAHEDSDDMQPFEVYKITKPINGIVIIYAHHISYRLSHCVAMPFTVSSGANACANTLAGLKSNAAVAGDVSLFSFWTDVHTVGTYNQAVPASIKSRLGGVEGSVLDQFGGEYEWDGFNVKLHVQRGSANTGFILKYGKNITDIEQEEELSNVITGVVPYWANMDGTDKLTLTEKVIYSPYVGNYPYHLTVPLDLSDQWQEKPSEATLRSAAQAYVNKSSLGVPKVSIKLSFVALWQTEEYKDIAPLEQVKMGDAVKVYFEKLGIEAQARVMGTEYNVLLERYDEIQIGSIRSTLAQTLNDQNAKTIQTVEATKQQAAQYTDEVVNNATAWLTSAGGYVVAVKNQDGSWKELLFVNHSDPSRATQGLRINNNGIGFWNKAKREAQHLSPGDMWNGPYDNAWTIDGNLIADFIHGGTLTLGGNNNGNGVLSFVDANSHEIIRIDRTGAYFYVWTYANSQWTKTNIGSWTPSGLTLTKGAINLGLRTDVSPNRYKFSVTDTGVMHAESGNIGGFTIDATDLRSGDLTSTTDGAVALTNADFARSINGTSRAGLRLAIGSNFGVNKSGNIFAAGATIDGSITSKDGTTRSTAISGGKITITTPSGGVYDQMKFERGSEYVEMGAHRVFYNDGEGHSVNATWEKIIEAANRPTT